MFFKIYGNEITYLISFTWSKFYQKYIVHKIVNVSLQLWRQMNIEYITKVVLKSIPKLDYKYSAGKIVSK